MTSSPASGTATSSLLSSKSLLSRLRSPLQSKSRNFTDFYIQPDDPHRQYAPGDIISGSVIVKIVKPLRITHLVISLHGYAQVYKNPNSPGDAYKSYTATIGNGKGKKTGGYFGNGFVSLFEDEVVLCGEGRLGEGVYHFNFELEFPSKGLPSSIDFERGTISYMLTATLTRPTTISPTTSDNKKVHFVDVIDVAPIPEPKPRIISLEPISRRTRTKPSRKKPPIPEAGHHSENSEATQIGKVSELSSVGEESTVPESPAPSDDSFESRMSSGNASGTEYGVRSINTTLETSSMKDSRLTSKGKTITATIELSKGGFLRGDQIPIRISVDHTKHVRSLKGIIITLYRQARVDMHPALPLAPNSKGDKTKSEDYYPKSRTGLGGLSLSSAGSSHLFRKDLSQSFAPLFVDPRTLTADVKCAVRIPDEAFPSISNVPGAMISFKYFVEVVVDIQGKLSGLDRMVPSANTAFVPLASSVNQGRADDSTGSMFSTWGGNFTDTDAIRREKGVISCLFEIVIGTKDSERNGKRKEQPQEPTLETQPNVHEISQHENENAYGSGDYGDYYGYDQNGQYYDEYGYDSSYWNTPDYQATAGAVMQPQYNQPPPHLQSEEGISEKERMRRAETRLLPSQPPMDGEASASTNPRAVPPSAPVLPDDEYSGGIYNAAGPGTSLPVPASQSPPPSFMAASSSRPRTAVQAHQRATGHDTTTIGSSSTVNANGQRSSPPLGQESDAPKPLSSLPQQSSSVPDYFPSPSSRVQPTDDKQELQRRRLEMETSAPPIDSTEGEEYASPGPSAPPTSGMFNLRLAPSAPVLDEHDEGLVDAVRPGQERPTGNGSREALPEYQR
ncbi:hypothetical protein DM02DRAFT_67813 [Periconia macrospinosa]|uniref:Arrestin C-terminal-like domain-containing protein n=1 Tax=Periconia macrospinosa TaxID=97972 RepID=A0A2V1DJK8_9PLEO|nr:hypothetical protein DM02DRAFT_67813 [Periconia macrospinosa]